MPGKPEVSEVTAEKVKIRKVIAPVALLLGTAFFGLAAFAIVQSGTSPASVIACAPAVLPAPQAEEPNGDVVQTTASPYADTRQEILSAAATYQANEADGTSRSQFQQQLETRKSAWLALAQTDPDSAMTATFSGSQRSQLESLSSDCVEQAVTLEGSLLGVHSHMFAPNAPSSVIVYELRQPDGQAFTVHFGRGFPSGISLGSAVRLSGIALDRHVVVDGTVTVENATDDFGGVTLLAAAGNPVLSNIVATVVSSTATVTWMTDIPADGIVNWGLTTAYGNRKSSFAFTTSHSTTFSVIANSLYHYAIRSCTSSGLCTTSPDMTFSTVGSTQPPIISNLTAAVSGTTATVSWTTDKVADGVVNWGPTSAYGSLKSDTTLVLNHALSFTVAAETTYHYAVRSCIPGGYCTTSADATFTTVPSQQPPVLSNIAVTGITATTATVTWLTDMVADSELSWGLGPLYGDSITDPNFGLSHTITLPPLSANSTYHYSVRSCTSGGLCSDSPDATFYTAAAPPVISNIIATPSNNQSTVSWTTDVPADSKVQWSLNSAFSGYATISNLTLGTNHSLSATSLTASTLYYYKVISCNQAVLCTTSAVQTFTTTGGSSSGPIISNISVYFGTNTATVSWSTNVAADGIVNYGTSTLYGSSRSDFAFTTSHAITLAVSGSTTYHYAIRGCTATRLCTTTSDATFTTPAGGVVPPPPPPNIDATLVLLVNFLNTSVTSPTRAQVESTMFSTVKDYYLENSYGRYTLSGEVLDWMTLNMNATCSYDTVTRNAVARAEQLDPNFHLSRYKHLVVIGAYPATGSGCYDGITLVGTGGVHSARDGYVSMTQSWVRDPFVRLYVLGHEFGHQLGSSHAAFQACSQTGSCSIWEYGDWSDIMGGNIENDAGHFNAVHKQQRSWFAPSNVVTVSSSGRYELEPLETASSGPKTLRLQRAPGLYLYLEYRQPIGFDAPLANQNLGFFNGALIHNDAFNTSYFGPHYDSVFYDGTPPNNGDWRYDVSLPVGRTYTDSVGNIITVVSQTPTKLVLDIVVAADPLPFDITPPTVTLTAPPDGAYVANTYTVKANATDNIGIARVDFYFGSTKFASDTTEPYEASFDTKQVANGSLVLSARAFDARNNTSTSSAVTVTVNNKTVTIIPLP